MDDPHLHPRSALRNVVSFLPALLWALILIVLSLAPGSSIERMNFLNLPYSDKIAHFGFYLVLAVLILHGFGRMNGRTGHKDLVIAVSICVLIGLLLECLQISVSVHRHFEVLDIIANIIGTLVGSALFNLLLKRKYYGS